MNLYSGMETCSLMLITKFRGDLLHRIVIGKNFVVTDDHRLYLSNPNHSQSSDDIQDLTDVGQLQRNTSPDSTDAAPVCSCQELFLKGAKMLLPRHRIVIKLNPIVLGALLHELLCSTVYRCHFVKNVAHRAVTRFGRSYEKCTSRTDESHIGIKVVLTSPMDANIDHAWDNRIAVKVRERAELDNLLAILSTLGGAYSSLGETMLECAKTAGKISIRQLRIASSLGDPITAAKCKVYMSISLLQLGQIENAKKIIRSQYRYALSLPADMRDVRLENMCHGVWAKLRYVVHQRNHKDTKST